MIQKNTVVDQIEITREGVIQVRMITQIVENGVVLASKYHRTCVEPGVSVDDQMAVVNAHLIAMGKAPCAAPELSRVKVVADAVHTESTVEAYRAEITARQTTGRDARALSVLST
jgi:hypothetical protein